MKRKNLSEADVDRVIEMAREDRTPYSTIAFGRAHYEAVDLMRRQMRYSSIEMR